MHPKPPPDEPPAAEAADDFFQFDGAADGAPPSTGVAPLPVPPRLGLLSTLDRAEFDVVARAAKLSSCDAGACVFRQGDVADRFYILVEGRVRIERDGRHLADLEPGSFFGESAILVGGRRSATVRAVGRCSLWSVPYEAFQEAVSSKLLADEQVRGEIERRIDSLPPGAFD